MHMFLLSSVGSQFSKGSYRMMRTRSSLISRSTWLRGTPMRSFECTQPTRLPPSDHRQRHSVANSVVTPTSCVPNTQRSHYRERSPPHTVARPERQRSPIKPNLRTQNQNPVKVQTTNHLTSRPTRSTSSVITQTTSSDSVQQTALRLSRSAPLPFNCHYSNNYHP